MGPFSIVLYTNMAVSSRGCKPRIMMGFGNKFPLGAPVLATVIEPRLKQQRARQVKLILKRQACRFPFQVNTMLNPAFFENVVV